MTKDRLISESRFVEDLYGCLNGCDFDLEDVLNVLKGVESVDATPVVHGKWLHDESGANFCSECMKYAYEDEEYHMIWHTHYCPHCGARLDEKDGEQDEIT